MDHLKKLRIWNEANGAPFSEPTLDGLADWVAEGAHAAGPPGANRRASGDELVAELSETFYDLTPEQASSLASLVDSLN
jgi:hypothetical protein